MNRHHGKLYILIAKFASKNFPLWNTVFDRYEDAVSRIREHYPERSSDWERHFVIKVFTKTSLLREVRKYQDGKETKFYFNPTIEKAVIEAIERKARKQMDNNPSVIRKNGKSGLVKLEADGMFHAYVGENHIGAFEKLTDARSALRSSGIRKKDIAVSYRTSKGGLRKDAYRRMFVEKTGFTPMEADNLRRLRDSIRIAADSVERLPQIKSAIESLGELDKEDRELLATVTETESLEDGIGRANRLLAALYCVVAHKVETVEELAKGVHS